MEFKINFADKLKADNATASSSRQLNIGYFFLQQLYHNLEIRSFFDAAAAGSKITFDPNTINRFLTCARILNPDSKLSTHRHLADFYEQPRFDYMHIMRTMDIMEEHYDESITHLFEKSRNIVKRDTSVCFYDCTNYYSYDGLIANIMAYLFAIWNAVIFFPVMFATMRRYHDSGKAGWKVILFNGLGLVFIVLGLLVSL